MNRSEMVEHDVNVRNAWVAQMPADAAKKIAVIAQPARLTLYKDLDAKIKTKYLEALQELNKDLEVIQLKGFGPLRQSKNQQPLDQVLIDVTREVLTESGFIVSN